MRTDLSVALSAVRDGARAASRLQRTIVRESASISKVDRDGTGHQSVSPVTVADFAVQALILSSLVQALCAPHKSNLLPPFA